MNTSGTGGQSGKVPRMSVRESVDRLLEVTGIKFEELKVASADEFIKTFVDPLAYANFKGPEGEATRKQLTGLVERLAKNITDFSDLSEKAITEALDRMKDAGQSLNPADQGGQSQPLTAGQGGQQQPLSVGQGQPGSQPLITAPVQLGQPQTLTPDQGVQPQTLSTAPVQPNQPQTLTTGQGQGQALTADMGQGSQPAAGGYKLKEGTVLGLDINAHELNICMALEYYKGTPIGFLFQLIARYYTGSKEGYPPEVIAQIRAAQVEKTRQNMDKIEAILTQRPINYVDATAKIAELTGGLVMAIGHPAGKSLQELRSVINLYDNCLDRAQGATPEEKQSALVEALKIQLEIGFNASEGSGFSALAWGLKRIAVEDYIKEHPIDYGPVPGKDGKNVVGEDGQLVMKWMVSSDDNPGYEELVARQVAACINNGITTANGVETYLAGENEDLYSKQAMEAAIQNAVAVEGILDPYEPVYDSSMSPQKILDREFAAARFNMTDVDYRSPSKVMEYLQVYRGIHSVKATRPGGKPHNISERALNAYIKKLVEGDSLYLPLIHNKNTNINRILEDELVFYLLDEPNDASHDFKTANAFGDYLLNTRNILNVEGIREEDGVAKKITSDDLDLFLNRLVNRGVMPKEKGGLGEINLNEAWEDYLMAEPEGAENKPEVQLAFREHVRSKVVLKDDMDVELNNFFKELKDKSVAAKSAAVVKPAVVKPVVSKPVVFDKEFLGEIFEAYLSANPGRDRYDSKLQKAFKADILSMGFNPQAVDDFLQGEKGKGKDKSKP